MFGSKSENLGFSDVGRGPPEGALVRKTEFSELVENSGEVEN